MNSPTATAMIAGGGAYNLQNFFQRWGDYSQMVVDPNDDMTVWAFQEYTSATNVWTVRGQKLFGQDCSFFLGWHLVRPRPRGGYDGVRRRMFAWMQRRRAGCRQRASLGACAFAQLECDERRGRTSTWRRMESPARAYAARSDPPERSRPDRGLRSTGDG